MEESPRRNHSTILVPLRVVCENMGLSVSQDSHTKAVRVHFVAENDLQFENKEMKLNMNHTNVSIQYPQIKWVSNVEIQRNLYEYTPYAAGIPEFSFPFSLLQMSHWHLNLDFYLLNLQKCNIDERLFNVTLGKAPLY